MKRFLLVVAALFFAVPEASAVCTTLASGLKLEIPNFNDDGDVWGQCLIDDFNLLNTTGAVQFSSNTFTAIAVDSITAAHVNIYVSSPTYFSYTSNTIPALSVFGGVNLSSEAYFAHPGMFKATGNDTFAIYSDSGGYFAKGVVASWLQGTFYGVGSAITALTPGNISAGVATNVTGLGAQAQALNMNSNLVSNVTTPVSANDAANKTYVDNLAPILDYKAPAKYIAVTALPANAYANGSSGVGATITGLGLGLLTIDGVSPAVGKRVVINGESTHSHNGIYTVTTNAGGAFFVLTRATDHDQSSEMNGGATVDITDGVAYDSTTWVQQTDVATVGTDAVDFYQTNGLAEITAGNGLLKSGTTIFIDPTTVGITIRSTHTVTGAQMDVQGLTVISTLTVSGAAGIKTTTMTTSGISFVGGSYTEYDSSANYTCTTASYTVSASSDSWSALTLGGNCYLTFNNFSPGTCHTVELQQGSAGSKLVIWNTPLAIHWATGTIPTLTTTAYKYDSFSICFSPAGIWEGYIGNQNY